MVLQALNLYALMLTIGLRSAGVRHTVLHDEPLTLTYT